MPAALLDGVRELGLLPYDGALAPKRIGVGGS